MASSSKAVGRYSRAKQRPNDQIASQTSGMLSMLIVENPDRPGAICAPAGPETASKAIAAAPAKQLRTISFPPRSLPREPAA